MSRPGTWPPPRVKRREASLKDPNTPFLGCSDIYRDIQRYYWEQAKLETREWNKWDFFFRSEVTRRDYEKAKKAWVNAGCPGPVPLDET